MDDYRIRVKLKSPGGTPWQSDTLFGHLCWQVAYGADDLSIDDFLKPFAAGRPAFVLSDGFPGGYLPRPELPRPLATAETLEDYAALKQVRKAAYVTVGDFGRICRGQSILDKPRDDPWQNVQIPHASIGRDTGRTGEEGSFFTTDGAVLPGGELDIYLRVLDDGWLERVTSLLVALSRAGFGRDKSTGYGEFALLGTEPTDDLTGPEQPGGFVSLSTMVPAANDPCEGRFRLRTKFGKVGEGAGVNNPFKRPLVQIQPGAAFRTDAPVRPFYGSLVTNIAPGDSRVVQNCYCLAAASRWPDAE